MTVSQVGRKIYYELSTGNVIVDTGERTGYVIETTEDQDWQFYTALQPYQKTAVGVLQLTYGQDIDNFGKYPFHIDTTQTPPVIAWDTANPIGATLADVQNAKVGQLRDMYNHSLQSGFKVTINSTEYQFACTADDIARMNGTQTAIDKAYLTYPVLYSDYQGAPVSIPDQATFNLIQETAAKFGNAQHQQVLQLIQQVQATTTNDAANAIQWTEATY